MITIVTLQNFEKHYSYLDPSFSAHLDHKDLHLTGQPETTYAL